MKVLLVCRKCREVQELELMGTNRVDRPIWKCPRGHTQAGPFPDRGPVAADGGRSE